MKLIQGGRISDPSMGYRDESFLSLILKESKNHRELSMGIITEIPNEKDDFVFFDISIGNRQVGRIVVQLFVKEAPKTCKHFKESLSKYENTYFHRVVKNFMIQGGDVFNGKVEDYDKGKAGITSVQEDQYIEDENLQHPLDQPFLLCLANDGPNTNSYQFFITTATASHLQGKNSVFGIVKHGKSVVREIERVSTLDKNIPIKLELPIIKSIGPWKISDEVPIFNACYDTIGGDIYEEYPDDDDTITKGSLDSALQAATIIKDSGGLLLKKGDYTNALFKYKKSLRYVMEYIPDIDQEPELFKKFVELKKKIYLNLALATLKQGDYKKSCEYGTFLLDMDLTFQEKAKTLYRMGCANIEMKKYEEAFSLLKNANELVTDPSIERDLKRVESLLNKKKDAEKAKYLKMFG